MFPLVSAPSTSTSPCQTPISGLPTAATRPLGSAGAYEPVIPLMSKEEGERLISQMPRRSLKEALEMMEIVLGRRMPFVEDARQK